MRIRSTLSVLFIFIVLLLTGGYLLEGDTFFKRLQREEPVAQEQRLGIITFVNGFQLDVEIADSASKRSKGLSGREELPEDRGMLFVHDRRDRHQFWMKDVPFALDFVWIDGNTVVDITENAAPEDPPVSRYEPKTPVNMVLEVNSGFIKSQNIVIGDQLDIQLPIQ